MIEDLRLILPEILLTVFASVGLIVSLFLTAKNRYINQLISLVGVVLAGAYCIVDFPDQTVTAFSGQFGVDPLSQGLKIFILGIMAFILIYARSYVTSRKIESGEFHALFLFSCVGMLLLVSAKSLLMIYLGLELLTLPLYALVALQKESPLAVEAGMKYFALGALASGMLLYGMSLLYGFTQSLELSAVTQYLSTSEGNMLPRVALVFILIGIAFKFGAAPFHMWIPDIYQGAPTPVTLLIATTPKIAAFGMAYRLLHDGMPTAMAQTWSPILMVIALLSLAVGNIFALVQTNTKRLLGYSTIAHMGYVFLALMVAPKIGYAPAVYYILTYAIVSLAAFGIIIMLSLSGEEADKLSDLKGLGVRRPWVAFLMLIVAFSLAGVPPTVGFYAKFTVLTALNNAGFTWLAAVAVLFSVIGAFYYLKIIRMMYFETPEQRYLAQGSVDFRVALSLNGLAVLGLGIVPAPLFVLCTKLFA